MQMEKYPKIGSTQKNINNGAFMQNIHPKNPSRHLSPYLLLSSVQALRYILMKEIYV